MYYRGVSKCVDCHVPVQKKILSVQITIPVTNKLLTCVYLYFLKLSPKTPWVHFLYICL